MDQDGWLMRLGDFKLKTLEHLEKKHLNDYNQFSMSLENTSMQYHQQIKTALLREFRKAHKNN